MIRTKKRGICIFNSVSSIWMRMLEDTYMLPPQPLPQTLWVAIYTDFFGEVTFLPSPTIQCSLICGGHGQLKTMRAPHQLAK